MELIDHAVSRYGKKVKFLTFREAQDRLDRNLLLGHPLRGPDGQDNGVRLLDVNNDGYLDVVIGNGPVHKTRIWSPKTRSWETIGFPTELVTADGRDTGVRFGVLRSDGAASMLVRNENLAGAWHFAGDRWQKDADFFKGLEVDGKSVLTARQGHDQGVRLRDLDRDGSCELIVGNPQQPAVFSWSPQQHAWARLPFALPEGATIVNAEGKDNGLRFVDVDEDGFDDVLLANEDHYSLHLFDPKLKGWTRKVLAGSPGNANALPMIARNGTNNGAWFHSRHLWVQNENTALLKDNVDRRSFNQLLESVEPRAKSPEASLRSIRVRPGFTVELVACEPLVQSPIFVAWGPDGKLWVVEMGDYPVGLDGKGKPGGRIKFLESTKGDGKYDRATVFLDGLSFPTSVLPWGKGVLVTCAPEIFYAEDTDGDGKADLRVPLYTGFHEGNPQHRVNSLVYGLDNWIYCANGDSGGLVKSVKTGASIEIRGRDLRIRPSDGGLEAQAGQTQYGRGRDDWGNWFGNNNSDPLYHYVLAEQYLRRNPHVAAPNLRVQVSVTPGPSRVYPISRTLPRFNDPGAANHFTSACSAIVYRDDLFGPAFAENTFVSEPVHNLVHREIMTPRGITFTSRRAADEQESEFLASSDNWFRPTTIQTGPDGALWVVDMYRQVIEHPEWIPPDWQRRLDLRAGADKGRIYRVYPVGSRPRSVPRLDRLDATGLVAALDSPNGWQRDMAQMLLVQRQDKTAVPLLEQTATKGERPLARLHALCTLDGLGALNVETLRKGLADTHPGVRRHAVRLCEPLLAAHPKLGAALVQLVDDPDAQVRLQLACTLGFWKDSQAGRALGRLVLRDGSDRHFLAAVLSSINTNNLDGALVAILPTDSAASSPALLGTFLNLATALGNKKAVNTLLARVGTPVNDRFAPWQFAALASLLDALEQQGSSLATLRASPELQLSVDQLATIYAAARHVAADPLAPAEERVAAVRILGRGMDRRAEDLRALAALLAPQVPGDLQGAAVDSLGRLRDPKVPELLLAGWASHGPALRARILDVLLQRPEWQQALLGAIERKQVPAAAIDVVHRPRLLDSRSADVRGRAEKVFAGAVNADREQVIRSHEAVLGMKGDPTRGRELFIKHCATCHRLGDVGHAVGPDLASLGDKSPPSLLIAILDPNRAVEARYLSYQAITRAGRSFVGVLASETGTSITLVAPDGKEQVILRKDLEELTTGGKSLMPEGLEKELKPQDLADVIAHVRGSGPQRTRKVFEGNRPETVRAASDGSLVLKASNCEIYGSTLVLEKQYGNLGYWSSPDDAAEWTVEVPRGSRFAVWFDYACDTSSAGNGFVVQSGLNQMRGRVTGTGSWEQYRTIKIGEFELQQGTQRLVVRGDGGIKGALLDLRAIKLVPPDTK